MKPHDDKAIQPYSHLGARRPRYSFRASLRRAVRCSFSRRTIPYTIRSCSRRSSTKELASS
jgi:hypothetical protein